MASAMDWVKSLEKLFLGAITDEPVGLACEDLTILANYARKKHNGRCISKKLADTDVCNEIALNTFLKFRDAYSSGLGITPSELVRSKFMRMLVKRTRANDENYLFLNDTIVPAIVSCMDHSEKILGQPMILTWLTEFQATMCDPVSLKEQKELFTKLPKEYLDILIEERKTVGAELVESIRKKTVTKENLPEIIARIKVLDSDTTSAEDSFAESTNTVLYYASKYLELIEKGGKYRSVFRESLVAGLSNLLKQPMFPDSN